MRLEISIPGNIGNLLGMDYFYLFKLRLKNALGSPIYNYYIQEDPSKESFLNLSTDVNDGRKFITNLFDKRDVFLYYIKCLRYIRVEISHLKYYVLQSTLKF